MLTNKICPISGRTYKFVRLGKKIIISTSETEYHVDLLRGLEGLEKFSRREIKKKIIESEGFDMGRIMRDEDGKIFVYGESITFQYPDKKTKEKVRPKTMEILRRQYPKEEFWENC